MTTTGFTLSRPNQLRRATFIPSAGEVAARRLYVGVTVAAAAVSATAVIAVAPLFF